MKSGKTRKSLLIIAAVTAITLYNIMPTLLYYRNNLTTSFTESFGLKRAAEIGKRVNAIESDSEQWIYSYCKLLNIKHPKVELDKERSDLIKVSFNQTEDRDLFQSNITNASNLITFSPKKLFPYLNIKSEKDTPTVYLKRQIPIHFDINEINKYFSYHQIYDKNNLITSDYREIQNERVLEISKATTAKRNESVNIERSLNNPNDPKKLEFFLEIAESFLNYKEIFSNSPFLKKAFFSTALYSPSHNMTSQLDIAIKGFQACKGELLKHKIQLKETINKNSLDTNDLTINEVSQLKLIELYENTFIKAIALINKEMQGFTKKNWITSSDLKACITNHSINKDFQFSIDTSNNNPIISSINVDYNSKKVSLEISKELLDYRASQSNEIKNRIDELIYGEITKVKELTSENIVDSKGIYTLNLIELDKASSFLKFNLEFVAQKKIDSIKHLVENFWERNSESLYKENYGITEWENYRSNPSSKGHFNLVLYSPILDSKEIPTGFNRSSLYMIGKDLLKLAQKESLNKNKTPEKSIQNDILALQKLISDPSTIMHLGTAYPFNKEFKDDIIFEMRNFAQPILEATREDWKTTGSNKHTILEFSDIKNAISSLNKIDDAEHTELLKWNDDYNQSQANHNSQGYMNIPAPTKSPFLNNIRLSISKYLRGDERKILHWGLDLNGGSTIRVILKDKENKIVSSEEEITRGINELYRRVNKMGVSDISIRKEGSFITLDFPSTQTLSASELVSSSSMTFHMVNEKFSTFNTQIQPSVNKFLQEVWNECVATNKTDLENVNKIAFSRLYSQSNDEESNNFMSQSAQALLRHDLILADPHKNPMTTNFDDKISKIAMIEGADCKSWNGQSHPLIFIFNNYALEGSSLDDIRSGYDPTQGNYLSFSIKSKLSSKDGDFIHPRKILHKWTEPFSSSEMKNIDYAQYTNGNGWRLAAILNDKIISMPRLNDAIKDHAKISGSFTQKEVSQLSADLKAGSLTYRPEIISETTISPELGAQERAQGIFATLIAFVAVLIIMIGYYRFAGVIASIAVIFNILLIWGTLQNINASLTLAGIAGIILTIGMAVDANVLIFERIREEQEQGHDIKTAITNGYKKAFSAIFDSNITTIIAALILLNFDSGPVKGFALTLIIGIISSMFTALYMTQTFFRVWIETGRSKTLKMLNMIPNTGISFMKYGKYASAVSLFVIFLGGALFVKQRNTLFGMDFTGGMTLELEVKNSPSNMSAKYAVQEAFIANGINPSDFSIRELDNQKKLKIYLSNNLNNSENLFSKVSDHIKPRKAVYSYEKNPKLSLIVKTLNNSGINLTDKSLKQIDKNFSSISGQISQAMRYNAILGLLLALASILIYITIRFEFTYALSATIGLGFDLLLTMSVLTIGKYFGMPLHIDLHTIAALMTIIGYSLNDTIIVFDRVRTDIEEKRNISFANLLDNALNQTLSRTIMTSLTTMVVLLSLVLLGGKSIFAFSFLMLAGVVIGTFSTLFISTTCLFYIKSSSNPKYLKGL